MEGRLQGTVVNIRESYAFIGHPRFPANVFFHFGALVAPEDKSRIRTGASVEFSHSRDADGRDRAERVTLL
ncbi:cold shock domain-containing protein [Microbacterium oxydans]|nr:cold shock domain-containing protein [Microbacterium oxydans]